MGRARDRPGRATAGSTPLPKATDMIGLVTVLLAAGASVAMAVPARPLFPGTFVGEQMGCTDSRSEPIPAAVRWQRAA